VLVPKLVFKCPDSLLLCYLFRDIVQNIRRQVLQDREEGHGFCMWYPFIVLRYGLNLFLSVLRLALTPPDWTPSFLDMPHSWLLTFPDWFPHFLRWPPSFLDRPSLLLGRLLAFINMSPSVLSRPSSPLDWHLSFHDWLPPALKFLS
jgi:hypothetical protein